jgi:uncharacterized protein DUF6228
VAIRIGSEGEFLLLSDEYEGSSTRSDGGQLSWIHAELSLSHLRASTKVGIVWGVDASLSEFFDDLAKNWRGWKGAKKWEAYEGGLGLSCTSDRLGHITVTVELREGSPERWLVRGEVPLEAGQLERLATEMRAFYSYRVRGGRA